jgi:hypothetical protein
MMSFDIQSRRDNLMRYRVQLRRAIERQQQLIAWRSGDDIDNRLCLTDLEQRLRGTEKEWAELEGMLGRPRPLPPVKYGTPARPRGTPIRAPGPYLTRVMGSR